MLVGGSDGPSVRSSRNSYKNRSDETTCGSKERKMHTCRGESMLRFCFLSWIVLLTLAANAEPKCAGLESAFDILPEGDHFVEYGNSLELYCKLNTSYESATGRNSSDLLFFSNDPNPWEPYEIRSVVNDTTIKLILNKPPVGARYYYCSFNRSSSCLTNVQVGYKPEQVDNFECKSWNWEKLNCTWTPKNNTIKTTYKLKLTLAGRAGRTPLLCPNQLDVKNNTCIFTLHTDPTYRQPHEYFTFELTGENALGNNTTSYRFHHYAHVIPDRPSTLVLVNKTVNSALIQWEIPFPLENFPPGLQFKIEYKSRWDPPDVWNKIEPRNENDQPLKINGQVHTYNITGLKYAYTAYDVRVYLKSYAAKAGPKDWSKPATLTFVTLPRKPSAPPRTTFGSFEIVSRGNDTDVYIYWNRINETLQNGADFHYEVTCIADDYEYCGPPTEKTLTFAKYPYSKFREYKFDIVSANEIGNSTESSQVFVPKFETVLQPEGFTKVSYSGGIYELSWNPLRDRHLSNYTLFWCEEDKDLPVPCRGVLDWIHVPKESARKNITVRDDKKFYKFAIAANSADGKSSGLVWSSCVIFHDKYLKKVDAVTVNTKSAREADVSWEVRCAQIAAIQGFMLYYCPVTSPNDSGCRKNEASEEFVEGGQKRNHTLTRLKPYTTYRVQVAIVSVDAKKENQVGPRKDSNLFTTHEGAPSEPYDLSADKITNSSVLLKWKAPKEKNGVLQTYKIRFNDEEKSFKARDASDGIVEEYELTGLEGHVKYTVNLKACSNSHCSVNSENAVFTTLIGTPGKMKNPTVLEVTNTSVSLKWERPENLGGNIDFYQVAYRIGNREKEIVKMNYTGFRNKISIPECKANNRIEFMTRAINLNEEKAWLYGPWSEPSPVLCGSSGWTKLQMVLLWLAGLGSFVILTVILSFVIKRGWLKCKKMKNLEIKLPSGLQNQDLEKDSGDNYYALDPWPPHQPDDSGNLRNSVPPDEESLLDKKSDESLDGTPYNAPGSNERDSSGCSVGKGSVSSSVTSDTHISSDSGAEADRCFPGSNDGSFGRWNSSGRKRTHPRKSHHRQNEADPAGADDEDFSRVLPDRRNGETVLGYARVGFDEAATPEKSLPGKGYVTIASVASPNPSQKTDGDAGYTTLPAEDFPRYRGEQRPGVKAPLPKYVALAGSPDRRICENPVPSPGSNGSSCSANDSPNLSHFESSTERDEDEDDASGDSIRDESSGNETETETVQGMPFAKNLSPMPPYVSMVENPSRSLRRDEESAVLDPPGKKTVKSTEKVNNYIPHRIFEKESFHT